METKKPRLWITYAWVDEEEGDFSHVVTQLEAIGIEPMYDRRHLIPGERLWPQIARSIARPDTDGWAILLTPRSISRQKCLEEHAYALDKALDERGKGFPMIGLLHGVRPEDLPDELMPLKVRLCVSLGDPEWPKLVLAGLQRRAPGHEPPAQTRFRWRVYGGPGDTTAVEVGPRHGEVIHWRLAVPANCPIECYGRGKSGSPPSGPAALARGLRDVISGSTHLGGRDAQVVGQGDPVSPSISAYVIVRGSVPDFVAFGVADGPVSLPAEWEIIRPDQP
jgi:hypothetical protein